MSTILVSGSLAYDKIMDFPGRFSDHILPGKSHILNVSFGVTNLRQNFGGTAGNIAYSLALIGEQPIILAAAGNDFEKYEKWLIEKGVNAKFIKKFSNISLACAHIITDQADNQITGFYYGAMQESIDEPSVDLIKNSKLAIVAPGNILDMINLPKIYKKFSLPYIFDPGQAIPALSSEQLRESIFGAKVFIANDYEMSLVLEKTKLRKEDIFKNTEIIITTLGEHGSVIETREKKFQIPPAKPDNTSDPTGAGDAYRVGLIKGLILGWSLEKAGQLAATVAAYTVEKYGTQTHSFTWESLQKRYKENFG